MSDNDTVSIFETKPTGTTCILTDDNNVKITFETPAQDPLQIEHTHYRLSCNASEYFLTLANDRIRTRRLDSQQYSNRLWHWIYHQRDDQIH
jgi:hypothetical protein